MSWDKNTVSQSGLDATKKVLDNLGVPYQESVIGKFRGRGLNDDFYDDKLYELRRLQYADKVILEYAELDADCDTDDVILSEQFDLKDEPKDWQAVRRTDKFGQYSEEIETKV